MTHPLLPELRTFAADLSRRAGLEMMEARKSVIKVSYKQGNEIVTNVDLRLERMIRQAITGKYPDHGIIGEEEGASGAVDKAEFVWYVDPIDGTRNFARSLPYYNVSLGIAQGEVPVAGAVYDPIQQECYSAHLGGGADCNGEAIEVSKQQNVEDAMAILDYHRSQLHEFHSQTLTALFNHVQKVRMMGAAALDLCNTARGRFDVMVAFGTSKYKRMDLMAGLCILKEADGQFIDLEKKEFSWNSTSLVAGSPALLSKLCDLLSNTE